MRTLTGHLYAPDGSPLAGWTVRLRANECSAGGVPSNAELAVTTATDGSYSVDVLPGVYTVWLFSPTGGGESLTHGVSIIDGPTTDLLALIAAGIAGTDLVQALFSEVLAAAAPGPAGAPGQIRFTGHGAPGTIIGATPDDTYLDLDTGNIYKLT